MMENKKILISILIIIYAIANISWFFTSEVLTLHPVIMAFCGIAILLLKQCVIKQEGVTDGAL